VLSLNGPAEVQNTPRWEGFAFSLRLIEAVKLQVVVMDLELDGAAYGGLLLCCFGKLLGLAFLG
jgi:hypothetical protein